MALTIIAIGKKHEDWVQVGIERYQKRLRAPMDVNWVLLPHSRFEGDRARQEESERIRARIPSDAYVLLLDERGVEFDSPKLARHLERVFAQGKQVVCIIGGAYGVTEELHAHAATVWSLSPLVFPHQLVRLILAEQLYRAQQIQAGAAYHHQ